MNQPHPGQSVLGYFRFFYGYLGKGMIWVLLFSLLVALLDGFGLAMFLPLLGAATESGPTMAPAGLDTVLDAMVNVGIPVDLTSILCLMLTFFILKGVARFITDYYRITLQERFIKKLRLDNLRLLADTSYEQFVRSHSGTIQNSLSGELVKMNEAYLNYAQMLQYLIMGLVYGGLAYAANPVFSALLVGVGLVSTLLFRWLNRKTRSLSRQLSEGTNDLQGYLIENVASFKFLKATNLMETYRKRVARSVEQVEVNYRKIGMLNALAASAREPLIITAVVVALLVQMVVLGKPLGVLLLSLLLFYRALTSLVTAQNCYNLFLGVSGSVENVHSQMREMSSSREITGTRKFSALQDGLRVKELTYRYEEGKPVLQNLSFQLDKFETLGVVGESGSGKTTLVNLLCSLLQAPDDRITVDGININDLDKASYRDRIGYVTQEPQLFVDTIRNNVSFWDARADNDDERVWKALGMAHAAEFVRAIPAQLDATISINGANLSGGQRQRISLARELYRGVDLLILDEATSSLDSESESLIQENIESLYGTLTLIVIAHRLSTLKKADKILFLKRDGEYEFGTFASLQKGSAKFREIIALQLI